MATIRGTTPTHIFKTNVDLSEADVVYVSYKQGVVVVEKEKSDLTFDEEGFSFALTQEETLKFRTNGPVKIQIRAKFGDGTAIASNVITTSASEILKEGVI